MKLRQISKSFPLTIVVVTVATFALGPHSAAQTRRPPRVITSLTDVANAMQFSPDGSTLAIARGTRDDHRVELWDTQSGTLRRAIRGFDGPVWSVSFSPDGKTLVSGSGGMHPEKIAAKPRERRGRSFTELKWWNPQTGELKQRVEFADEDLVSIAALHSPDGRLLATVESRLSTSLVTFDSRGAAALESLIQSFPMRRSAAFDSNLKILDARTGAVIVKLKDRFTSSQIPIFRDVSRNDFVSMFLSNRRLAPIVFSPDGRFVVAWKGDEAKLWDSATGAEVLKIKKFKGRLSAVAFSSDSRLLAGAVSRFSVKDDRADFKSEIRVWEVATGAPKQVFPLSTHSVSSLIFANNGHQLLIGGLQFEENHSYASMELADLQTGSVGKIVANSEGDMSSIALSSDGNLLAFQTDASTVKLLNTSDWRTKYTLDADHESASDSASLRRFLVSVRSVPAVAFLPDGRTVTGEVEGGGIKLWDARTGEVKKAFAEEDETGAIATVSADGSTVAEISSAQAVRLWNIETGMHKSVPANNRKVLALSLSGNGKTLAIAEPGRIVLMDTRDLKPNRTIDGLENQIGFIVLSVDGKLVAAATAGVIKIWNTKDGTLRQTILAGAEVSALRFGPQDQIAVGRIDGSVGLWNLSSGTLTLELKKHNSTVNAIAFSTDGTLMATGGDDRTAIIWEIASRKARRTLKGHDLAITSLAFSPDGAKLAVGSGNASVVLWEVTTGKLDRVLR